MNKHSIVDFDNTSYASYLKLKNIMVLLNITITENKRNENSIEQQVFCVRKWFLNCVSKGRREKKVAHQSITEPPPPMAITGVLRTSENK